MRFPKSLPPHERPPLFNRKLWGVTFRWPRWWEWPLFAAASLLILSLGSAWWWVFGLLWAFWAFRLGPLLNYHTPMASVAVTVVLLLVVNVGAWALVLAGLAAHRFIA